jgi:probable O-glycosylation ligase (exosortase A-associated)
MCLITIPLFIDRKKLKYLFLTIGLSLGFLGLKGGIFTILNAGQWNVRGPDGSFISGEGDFGLALNMTLPVLFYLAREEENKKFKMFLYLTFVMSAISVIFTYRRGAFLGLAAVIFMLALKARKKVIVVGMLVFTLIAAPYYITEKWTERMGTITTYENDPSAMGRINAWKMAFNVAKDRPLTGSGFEGLSFATIAKYSPNPNATAGDVHSIYFEVLGEHGFIAFGLFMFLLFFCFLDLRRIKKATSGVPSAKWIGSYSDMLQVSLIAYMVGGTFLGRAYFDLFYHLVAAVVILKILAEREINSINAENQRLV